MKKLTTMLCAAVMAASMTFTSFAAPSPSADVVTTTEVPMTVGGEQVVVAAKTLTVSNPADTAAVAAVVEKAAAPVVEVAETISTDPVVVAKVEEAVTQLLTLAVKAATSEEFKEFKKNCEIFEDKTTTEDGKIRVLNPDGTEAEAIEGTVESVSDVFTLEMKKVSEGTDAEGEAAVLDQTFDFKVPAETLGVTEEDTLLVSVYTLEESEENGVSMVESFVKAAVENGELKAELPAKAIAAEVKKVVPEA